MKPALFLLLAAAPAALWAAPRETVTLDKGWEVRLAPGDPAAKEHPKAARWLPARVPGYVQTDLIAAKITPDPFLRLNEATIQWVGRSDWDYRGRLNATPALLARDHVDLVFDGLDTFAEVYVNGTKLLAADNAHRRWRADAKPLLKTGANEIRIAFKSPLGVLKPMVAKIENPLPGEYDSTAGDEPEARQTSPYIRKPKYHYGWDWGPRIVNVGPNGPVRVDAWDDVRIDSLRVQQEAVTPAEARLSADVTLIADRDATVQVDAIVTAPDGSKVRATRTVAVTAGENRVSVPVAIANPKLWYPAGYGAQPLYTVDTETRLDGELVDSQQRSTGIRTVELVREKDAIGRGFLFRINGVPVFAKGANLIPFDSFGPRVTDTYMAQIMGDAQAANMNMLRIWGGGMYLPDSFFDTADRLGLMIWSDFMFGGAITPYDPEYRETVKIEAEEQVDRVQAHPSIVLWSGNNEVLSGWEGWSDRTAFKKRVGADEQERVGVGMAILFDRVLRDAASARDADVPYWPGSPSANYEGKPDQDGNGDRHYWDVWGGKKPATAYLDSCPRFMSEYGLQAMPDMATIAKFAKPADYAIDSPVMTAHQKFLKGAGQQRLLDYIRMRYREPRDFADFVYLSQVMQADGIQLGALHHRACRPVTSGTLYWQLNDVWPGASWSSIDYYGRWKALHFAARRFFAPLAISAARKADGPTEVALISDATRPVTARWRVRTIDADGRVASQFERAVQLPALSSTKIATLTDADLFKGADPKRSFAVFELLVDGQPTSRALVSALPEKAMDLPDPGLTTSWSTQDGKPALTITAKRLARALWIGFGTLDVQASDNFLDLLPGESVTVTIDGKASTGALRKALRLQTLGANK
ncbi:beta-mannosidase [Sphingomonas sp. Leaf22]|uniref:beta-mannosidase n=1 Tax=Sphingomonas sp. Leaf22 TaxID=1735687 RepID=UPI0006FF375F|nr:glycoside hydrolase family 2 protein [Sphingomonas sp. Leaf22]KQM76093.1 beta-mannosidase [Sphingomonas sp. Leaf22]